MYFDVHCHLADERLQSEIHDVIERSTAAGVRFFIQGGVDPKDWDDQEILAKKFPYIKTCRGLHPYFVAQNDQITIDRAFAKLKESTTKKTFLLGECGLDFRAEYLIKGKEHQIYFFEEQMNLALSFEIPVALHIVRSHDEALRSLKKFTSPKGFVHAFDKDKSTLRKYLDLGLYISVGGALLRDDRQELHDAVKYAPLDRLLAESDSPDQLPKALNWKFSEPRLVPLVVQAIAKLKNIDQSIAEQQIWKNGKRLFPNLNKEFSH